MDFFRFEKKIIYFCVHFIDNHILGCGDRAIAIFDHLSGDLLVHFEIDVPTIGRNLAVYTCNVEVSEMTIPHH